MSGLKDWKLKLFDIETFREVWDSNFRVEVASGLLYTLKNAEDISIDDKVGFFVGVLSRLSGRSGEFRNIRGLTKDPEQDLFSQALEYFFDLIPIWKASSSDGWCKAIVSDVFGKNAFHKFGNRDELKQKFSANIKKFLNSLLNKGNADLGRYKADHYFWAALGNALFYNEMFEELVNYDFTGIEILKKLASRLGIRNGPAGIEAPEIHGFSGRDISAVLAQNKEPKVISAFLRLLARRSDRGYGYNIFNNCVSHPTPNSNVYIFAGMIYVKLT